MCNLSLIILSHRPLRLISCLLIWFCVCCLVCMISIILSSISLFHSSVLFLLLLFAFSSVCISDTNFLIFSSSFLKESALLVILSPHSFSIFTISLVDSKSVKHQRSVSLLPDLGEFSCSFNQEWFLSFFILLVFSFLFLWIWESQTALLYHYSYARITLCIFGELPFIFCCANLNICCLFLQCEQADIPRVLTVFSGRRRQWVGQESVPGHWPLSGRKDLQEGGTGNF